MLSLQLDNAHLWSGKTVSEQQAEVSAFSSFSRP